MVPDLDLAANLMLYQSGITFSISSVLQHQNLFNNSAVKVFQLPMDDMRLDTGISFKSNDNPTVNLMISLIITELREEQQNMPRIIK